MDEVPFVIGVCRSEIDTGLVLERHSGLPPSRPIIGKCETNLVDETKQKKC